MSLFQMRNIVVLCIYLSYVIPLVSCHNDELRFSSIAANDSYSCPELKKWVSTEKHYSNKRKDSLFSLMVDCEKQPVVSVDNVEYTRKSYFIPNEKKCKNHDKVAVSILQES